MIDWQPIETAPKDGTTVLLWAIPMIAGPRARYALGAWLWGGWRISLNLAADPTHWAPLNPPEGA